jgi:signal transduction histidine kinase/ActR/RegA family two-component response regulator
VVKVETPDRRACFPVGILPPQGKFAEKSRNLEKFVWHSRYFPVINDCLVTLSDRMAGPEAALATTRRDLCLVLDLMAEGALVIGGSGGGPPGPLIQFVNQGLLGLTGWAAEDLVGQPLAALHGREGLAELLARLPLVARTGKRYHIDAPTRCADGGERCLRWFLRAAADGGFVISVRQPPEEAAPGGKPEREEALRAGRMEALAQVASGVAHDFNNVLAAVMASVQLARSEDDPEIRQSLLEDARAGCESARVLVRRLLGFARGVGGGTRSQLDPLVVTEEAVKLASFGSNIRCDVQLAGGNGVVEADPVQLLQVLSNLLINARQAMPGGGTVEIEINLCRVSGGEIPALKEGDYVTWTVRDRGCGIPDTHLEQIFQPFYTTKRDGTGLGLANSLRLAREHGGTIVARSKLGAGSEFRVFLPASAGAVAAPAVVPAGPQALDLPAAARGEGLVLVADDQGPVREAIRRQLEHLGYRVVAVASGAEAVAAHRDLALRGHPPLAVLMDLTFNGGLSGSEAAREIRAFDPAAMVVACSGYLTGDADAELAEGFAATLAKPFSLDELAAVMARAARQRHGLAAAGCTA